MTNRVGVGPRVAAIRKTRGWTARELARRARVSYSLLTKAETGAVPATPALIGAVARALGVDVSRITGQPYEEPGGAATLQAAVAPLRRALLAYDLPPETDAGPRSADELRAEVIAVSLLGRQARYLQLSQRLPGLLERRQAAIATASEPDRPALYALLAEAYGGISGLAHQLGYADLRALTLDRIEWAARLSGGALRVGGAQGVRGAVAARRPLLRPRPGADGTHPRRDRRRRGRPRRACPQRLRQPASALGRAGRARGPPPAVRRAPGRGPGRRRHGRCRRQPLRDGVRLRQRRAARGVGGRGDGRRRAGPDPGRGGGAGRPPWQSASGTGRPLLHRDRTGLAVSRRLPPRARRAAARPARGATAGPRPSDGPRRGARDRACRAAGGCRTL